MIDKFIQFTLFIVICSLFSTNIKCLDIKNKKPIHQNGLTFYQIEPVEWWNKLIYIGQPNQLNRNLDNFNKLKYKSTDLNKKKFIDKNANQLTDLDDFDSNGSNDFELINFWPGPYKRDTDYGHLRFGRAADFRAQLYKKTLDKKVEPDYGHFRFG